MVKNKYLNNLFDLALSNKSSLLIPESDDIRIQKAVKKLKDIGFDILDINDFNNNDRYYHFLLNYGFSHL